VTTVRIGKLDRRSPKLWRPPCLMVRETLQMDSRLAYVGALVGSKTRRTAAGLVGVDFDNRSYAWGAIVNQDNLVYAAFEFN
jgi:hypothetical protein